MHPNRRRKKRPNYGIRTVEVLRGCNGFGFTISGQQPCILSCIVANSPADQSGLRAGDFLISVNGISVSKITHDAVVNLIGNCIGPIRMTIAENYYSDSSEEELDISRVIAARKPKYMHKPRTHRLYKQQCDTTKKCEKYLTENQCNDESPGNMPLDGEMGPVEYKALVGYLGTIEMPNQLLPNSRLQTVSTCIKKLRQEKRSPTAVLMTIFPTCLTLKNSSNHILAIYPTNRVVYIGSTADKESRYFGLVTSAVSDTNFQKQNVWDMVEKKLNNVENEVDISNSCHVFMVDPKIMEHNVHFKKAETFKISCTSDLITGNCLEFPRSALYIVNLVQNMYKLQSPDPPRHDDLGPVVANSPQPSASSNSDSGIGFRDDCGNVSDRILVVEFPAHRPYSIITPSNTNRPAGIDATNIPLDNLDLDLNNHSQNFELNNTRYKNLDVKLPNNLSDKTAKQYNNLNNIRACGSFNIRNVLEKTDHVFLAKQNNNGEVYNKLTCRVMPDRPMHASGRQSSTSIVSSDDNGVPEPEGSNTDIALEVSPIPDNVVFKTPNISLLHNKKLKRNSKMVFSCDNLDKFDENIHNRLSPKVYGVSKPNYSCEELSNLEKYGYGSLQELNWDRQYKKLRSIAKSEPDVRIERTENYLELECEENGNVKSNTEGPAGWASSFEKLLEDPFGLHTFAEFLKKEFSAENIYFWTACERYRRLPAGSERIAEAQRIYQQHLSVGAPEGVNVDSHGRQCAGQSLDEASNTLFDQAQKQIFNLMKFDSYPRFLKSDLYKQCLSGNLEKPQIDSGLLLQPPNNSTPAKLKKSLSNAEDRRRKSLLPWHRKNRSKSKDRGETEYNQKRSDIISSSNENINRNMGGASDVHSSKSSLTTSELATTSAQDFLKGSQDELSSLGRNVLCRILLNNGSTTVVQIKPSETIQQLISRLLEKRGLTYSAFEVFTDKHPKAIDVNEPSTKLATCEVTVEQRVVFKIDLPNKKIISVKSKYTKIIGDVLRPILLRYSFKLDNANVTTCENEFVDITLPVTSIDGKRLKIFYNVDDKPTNPIIKVNNVKAKLDEITNQVFEDILQEKSETGFLKPKSDKGSIKSEDWGSEHSSGIFGRFLRRDSGLHDRKKKTIHPKVKEINGNNFDENEQIKKPIIAKWKAGVHKLQVSCNENDDLVEGLTRAQRRLEDQRGTEINFELPDFLKDKDEIGSGLRAPLTSRFYVDTAEDSSAKRMLGISPGKTLGHMNYENRNILNDFNNLTNDLNFTNNNQTKLNNLRTYSPNKFLDEKEKCKESPAPAEKAEETSKIVEPPPLPPKPKIIPIKPPNWGQNGFYKNKDLVNDKKSLYLEQPSSSFV